MDITETVKNIRINGANEIRKCLENNVITKPIVVTSFDNKYEHLLELWGRRIDSLGSYNKIALNVGNKTKNNKNNKICHVNFGFYDAKTNSLPFHVGLTKFILLSVLSEYKFKCVTYSEIDVYWFKNIQTCSFVNSKTISVMDNVHNSELNFGFFSVNFESDLHFFKIMEDEWSEILIKTKGNAGRSIASDQNFFTRQIIKYNIPYLKLNKCDYVMKSFGRCCVNKNSTVFHTTSFSHNDKVLILTALYKENIKPDDFGSFYWNKGDYTFKIPLKNSVNKCNNILSYIKNNKLY